jgi:hypothetical protein
MSQNLQAEIDRLTAIEAQLTRVEKLLGMMWDQQQRAKHLTADEQFELTPPVPIQETNRMGLNQDQSRWFNEFWGLYWRKVAKVDAAKVFAKRIKTIAAWNACKDLLLYVRPQMMQREPDKRPHAASWLNREDFFDADALAELQAAEVWKAPERMSRAERDLMELQQEMER